MTRTLNGLLKQYPYKLDGTDIIELKGLINTYGIDEAFNKCLHWLDCTRTMENGMRIIQTINENYKYELARIAYVYSNVNDNLKPDYENRILQRHFDNLAFEENVEPIVYDKNKNKTKKISNRKPKAKEADMFHEETKKGKYSKAEAKLKLKIAGGVVFGSFKLNKD